MSELDRRILATSPAAVYICKADPDYDAIFISDNVTDLTGYQPADFLDDCHFWINHLHPDDLDRVMSDVDNLREQHHQIHEYRFRVKDGGYRWLRDEFRLVRNEAADRDEMVGSWLDITDRKELEDKYRRFAGLTSDFLHICSRKGEEPFGVQWLDGAISSITGYGREELLQVGCFFPLVHADDREAVATHFSSLRPGDRKRTEFRIVTRDNEIRWVSERSQCEAGPSPGELLLFGAITDITARKRAEATLKDSETFLKQAARIARLGRWRWNIVTGEIDWSSMTLEIFGLTDLERDVTYADFIGSVHPDDRTAVETAVQEAMASGNPYAIEHRIVRQDGSLCHVQEKGVVYYDTAGKPERMVGTVLDVTEQKLFQQRLEESNRIKNEFIAAASHELRTPLSVIHGYSEFLLGTPDLDARQLRECLVVINSKAEALEKIVADLLDVSRIETGRMISLELGTCHIVEKIRKTVGELQRQADGHRIALALPEGEFPLTADRAKIAQVMENLLGNAVKFSPQGSEITVSGKALANCFVVMVADQGPGIAPEDQEHIFDKFYRVAGRDASRPGLGLGLYLVKQIIEAHGGKIWIESTLGTGSKFFFTLPFDGPPED